MDQKLIGQATPEQIEQWKNEILSKYGEKAKVFKYEVDGRVCYVRSVDRNLYSLAATKISTSPAKFTELIIDGIWLGGDTDLKKNDSYYFGLIDFVEELMNKKKGELGEL